MGLMHHCILHALSPLCVDVASYDAKPQIVMVIKLNHIATVFFKLVSLIYTLLLSQQIWGGD